MLWSALVCQALYSHLFVLLLRPITYRLFIDYPNSNTNRRYATFNTSRNNSKKPPKLADAKRGREDDETGDRAKKMCRRSKLAALKIKATEELNALKRNDPQSAGYC